MNEFGRLAMAYWRSATPGRYSQITDPQSFFTDLGEQVQARVTELEEQTPPGTTDRSYLARLAQLNQNRALAREVALAELVYLEPEDRSDLQEPPDPPTIGADGMPTDPDHPLWAAIEDDTVSAEMFADMTARWRAQERASQPPTPT